MKILGKAVWYLLIALISVLLAFTLFLFISNKVNPGSIPSAFGYKVLTVLSGSMRPEFNPGDLLIAKDADTAKLNKGDIITFTQEDKYVTHRITEINEQNGQMSFITKGDFNDSQDPTPIAADKVVAVYSTHIPFLGMFLQELNGIYGFLLLVVLPVVILVVGELRDSIKRRKKRAERIPPVDMKL